MGEKYIKRENGKEVIYERGFFFDTKMGETRKSSGLFDACGTKEIVDTSGIFNKVVGKIEPPSSWSPNERKTKIGDEEGVFKKGGLQTNPTFRPKEKPISIGYSSEYSGSCNKDSGRGYSSGSLSSSSNGSSGLVLLLVGVLAFGAYFSKSEETGSQYSQQKSDVQILSARSESNKPFTNSIDFNLDLKMKCLSRDIKGSNLENVSFFLPENRKTNKTEYSPDFLNPAFKINAESEGANYNVSLIKNGRGNREN